ncbi:MAG: hydroxymethylbilane synthase [Smithellaceae bacterium]|nr:hydroxymethylbilane synthase [Smithellaceae bacterium]
MTFYEVVKSEDMTIKTFKIGTRGSALALAQANWVAGQIRKEYPQSQVELVVIKTKGDIMQDVSLVKIGGKGVFVKEIEDALLEGKIDLAVHSMKDVPAILPEALAIIATPAREDPRDVLISRNNVKLETLRRGARIGTGSLRRGIQIREFLPDLEVVPLRGNLDTRIKKIEKDNLDGIILAAAGMRRLGWVMQVSQFIPVETMLPAVGQGVIGIEIKETEELRDRLSFLQHQPTWEEVAAERAFLLTLGGGCQLPIAGYATRRRGMIILRGLVGSMDGKTIIRAEEIGLPEDGPAMGKRLAEHILERGGRALLEEAYFP